MWCNFGYQNHTGRILDVEIDEVGVPLSIESNKILAERINKLIKRQLN